MIDHVESELRRLPEPVPPAALAGIVMARVWRLAEERTPASLASPALMGSSGEERVGKWHDVLVWAGAFAGLVLVFVSWLHGRLEAGSSLDLVSWRIGAASVVRMPPNGPAVLGLALGLVIYVAGLFAPIRNKR